ncbi:hypothetical protein [Cupriavidus sp. D39]|uniref:hypothetical protein n=1 Tax=Cupriavidus sp. D39 TaxID=2997877 RepID=UPI00226D7DBD|nr:hypothetical protein [Cupriavidus sp. D39]MCY0854081.1 hypothetical protein [Cupriavidus sp. D39]
MSSERAFPHDFNVGAFFTAMPATLKRNAKNGKSHLKILRAQGKGLQSFLETAYSLQLSHAQAMDAVARSLGFADFNEAREVLVRAPANSAKDKWSKSAALGNRWANLADVCRDGGFVIGAQGIVEHLTSSPGPVITGLNLMPRPEPEGWYTGAASRFSKKSSTATDTSSSGQSTRTTGRTAW